MFSLEFIRLLRATSRSFMLFILGVVAIISSTANARLIDRGNGLIYDDVLNITWTQNASLPGSQTLNWFQAAL